MRLVAVLALSYSVALVACGDNQPKPPPPSEEVTSFPAVPNPDLDLLFLIDDSVSTEYELSLFRDMHALFEVLATLDAMPNVHIGVATSDLGTTGSLDPEHPAPPVGAGAGACSGHGKDGELLVSGGQVTGSFLVDVANSDGSRMTNYTGALVDTVGEMMVVGVGGCGFEQHLAGIKRALTNPMNAGFLRPSANLGVILVGDEDDCSVHDAALFGPDDGTLGPLQSFRCTHFGIACDQDIAEVGDKTNCHPIGTQYIDDTQVFVDFLMGLKDDSRRLMFAAIVGNPEPVSVELRPPPGGGTAIPALAHSCNYSDSQMGLVVADPAVRDAAVVSSLPGAYTALTSVCFDDLRPQLTTIGHQLKRTIGDPCVPGIPHTCIVTDDDHDTPLPECPADGDCFSYVRDGRACPDGAQLRIAVHRVTPPRAGSYVHVRCEF